MRYRGARGAAPRKIVERARELAQGVTYPYPRAMAECEIAAALAREGDIAGALRLPAAWIRGMVASSPTAFPGRLPLVDSMPVRVGSFHGGSSFAKGKSTPSFAAEGRQTMRA